MNTLKNKIEQLIPDNLVLIDLIEDPNGSWLKVIIDGADSVDLKTTTKIAKKIKSLEFIDEFFPAGIQFEVSTPGIDSALVHPFQYKKNLGRYINIKLKNNNNFDRAKLIDSNSTGFECAPSSGSAIKHLFDEVDTVKVEIKI